MLTVTNIVIANIIGAGIFTTTGYIMDYLGSPVVMLFLWLLGGLIAFCGAISFAELGATYPKAGGEYFFIHEIFHPLPGFLSGWLSLIVGFSAPIAASAIGFAGYLIKAIPASDSFAFPGFIESQFLVKIIAILIIVVFTFIHSRGIVFGGKVQNGLTIMKIGLIAGLVLTGFLIGKGSPENLTSCRGFHFSFSSWKSIGLSLMFIMFAYSGWNSATYIGAEIRNPRQVIPWSSFLAMGVVVLLYMLLNFFYIYAIPANEMTGVPEIAEIATRNAFGVNVASVISLFISFALISSLSAFVILGPRVYYSMAKKGYFFTFAAKIHPKFGAPVGAILLQSAIAIILVLTGTFEQILVYMGFSLGIFPILAVLGIFKIRKKGLSKLKLPGYPFVQIIFIFFGTAMLVLAFLEKPVESSIAILTTLLGVPVYFWFKTPKT